MSGPAQRRESTNIRGGNVAMKRIGTFVVTLILVCCAPGAVAGAEESKPAALFAENVKTMLDGSVGRTVTLHLASGQEITGTVMRVGDHVVQLSRLAGRDFYDAVVMLDRVDAVLFKVFGK